MLLDGSFQRSTQLWQGDPHGRQSMRPFWIIPAHELSGFSAIIMSRWKLFNSLAYGVESLHLARNVSRAIPSPSYVQRNNPDVVSCDKKILRAFVEQSKRENPAEHIAQRGSVLVVEVENYLAI